MRSDQVFLATQHLENRFLLCQWVRVASRKFHRTGEPIQDTISKVLELVPQQPPATALADRQGGGKRQAAAASGSLAQEWIRNAG